MILRRHSRLQQATADSQRYKLQGASDTERQTRGGMSSQVSNAEAQLRSAQAALVQAQAQYEHQNADTSRTVALAAQGIMSYQSRDEAATALNAAQAAVDSAKANVAAARSIPQGRAGKYHSNPGRRQDRGRNPRRDGKRAGPAEPGAGPARICAGRSRPSPAKSTCARHGRARWLPRAHQS